MLIFCLHNTQTNFTLKDDAAEKKWGFTLKESIGRAQKQKFLDGVSVFETASTRPGIKDVRLLQCTRMHALCEFMLCVAWYYYE